MGNSLNVFSIPHILKDCINGSFLQDINFTEEYPKEAVTAPTITWSIHRRSPGKDGKETKKARYREEISSADDTDSIMYFGQWMTVLYQFDIFHSSNSEVNELLLKFEQFLLESVPTIIAAGADQFIFDEQLADATIKPPQNTAVRSLRYLCIYTNVIPVSVPRFREIRSRYFDSLIKDSMPILRSSLEYDAIPGSNTIRVISGISDTPLEDVTLTETSYLEDIDYRLGQNETGAYIVEWSTSGRKPALGATYYIFYVKHDNYLETSLIRKF